MDSTVTSRAEVLASPMGATLVRLTNMRRGGAAAAAVPVVDDDDVGDGCAATATTPEPASCREGGRGQQHRASGHYAPVQHHSAGSHAWNRPGPADPPHPSPPHETHAAPPPTTHPAQVCARERRTTCRPRSARGSAKGGCASRTRGGTPGCVKWAYLAGMSWAARTGRTRTWPSFQTLPAAAGTLFGLFPCDKTSHRVSSTPTRRDEGASRRASHHPFKNHTPSVPVPSKAQRTAVIVGVRTSRSDSHPTGCHQRLGAG